MLGDVKVKDAIKVERIWGELRESRGNLRKFQVIGEDLKHFS